MNFEDMHTHFRALFADGLSLRSGNEEFTVENEAVKMEWILDCCFWGVATRDYHGITTCR